MIYALFVCSYLAAGSPMECQFFDGPYRSVEDCKNRQKIYPLNIGDDHVGHTIFRCMGKPGWAAVN